MLVLKAAGLDMIHVPYRGVAPAFTDLLAGHIAMVAGSPVELKPYLNSGKLKPLAVLDTKRSPHLPNVPIVTDTLKDCPPAVTYNGLLGPAHLPKEVVETLSRELVAAGKSKEFRQRLLNVGLEPLLNTPEDFAKIIAAEFRAMERHHARSQSQAAVGPSGQHARIEGQRARCHCRCGSRRDGVRAGVEPKRHRRHRV